MSLDAVVFKCFQKMAAKFGAENLELSDDGQVLPVDEANYPLNWGEDEEEALSVRIGNISLLSRYREHLAPVLPAGLIHDILWGQTNGATPVGDLDELEAEAVAVAPIAELKGLSDDLLALIKAAREERNPIVWL